MSAATVPIKPEMSGFWRDFQWELENRIREANAVAGQMIWQVVIHGETSLSISRLDCPDDRMDCVFDPDKPLLVCTSGPGIPGACFAFEWKSGEPGILCRGSVEFTLTEALGLVLDELVWPDE